MAGRRKSAVRFEERADLLDFLLNVSDLTTETLDLDRLLATVAHVIKDVIPADLFAILLYSERTRGLSMRYSIGHREEVVRHLVIPLGEGIVGAAALSRTPILVNDVRTDARYMSVVDAVRSELAVPMSARGKLVGVIDAESTRLNAYTEHDRALLRLLANRVAIAIDNARLYRRVERQNRTLRALAYLSHEFSSILVLDELLSTIAKTLRALINYDAFSILLLDAERGVLRHRFSERYDQRVDLDNVPVGKGITGAAAQSREPVRVNDTTADPRYIASHPDIHSEVAIPLIVQDRVIGVLDVESERLSYFTDEHVRMLAMLAPQIASSVENARLYEELNQREQRMEQDLKAARKLQRVLLPREAPEIRGLDIAIRGRAAREITGDIYDFFEHNNEHSMLAFGDVSGKGPAAALYGALVSGLIRTLGPRRRGPAVLLRTLNDVLLERKVDAQYATLLVVLWEFSTRRLIMANAGAEPPLVCRRGEVLRPHIEGVPIGLLDDRDYEESTFDTEEGDLLLFCSDGIEDQLNPAGADFGPARLDRALIEYAAMTPQEVVDRLFDDLDRWRDGAPITDDQTMIVARVH